MNTSTGSASGSNRTPVRHQARPARRRAHAPARSAPRTPSPTAATVSAASTQSAVIENGLSTSGSTPRARSTSPDVICAASSPASIPVLVTTAMPTPLPGNSVAVALWVRSWPL